MSKFNPTDEQRQAMDSVNTHAAVTAGAGAGKTKVLISRILNIVLENKADFHEIVAITFTEKAATEMKVKLRREAREEMSNRLELRDKLAEASLCHISTIHSFCSSIIRRFALDLHQTPDYQVLVEDESLLLLTRSIEEILTELEDENLDYLIRFQADNFNLVRDIASTYNNIREFGYSLDEAKELTHRRFLDAVDCSYTALENYIDSMDKAFDLKEDARGSSKTAKFITVVLEKWPENRDLFLKLRDKKEKISPSDQLAIVDYLSLLDNGTINDRIFGEKIVKDVSFGIEVIPFIFTKDDVSSLLRGLYEILDLVDKHYQNLKKERHVLDFIDLQLKALEIIRQEDVKKELLEEIKYIMVDEYQDTNYLQQRIIDELWSDSVNLFIVGDPKQSIYRFRGAEVALFEKTKKEIVARGGQEICLTYNFRSELGLIEFYNQFFEEFMPGNQEKPYAIGYEKVKTKKEEYNDCLHILACYYDSRKEGVLEPKRWQAKAIAKYIYEAVNNSKTEQKVKYGDFAVLFHKRSAGLTELEEELSKLGIPFVSGMGTEFFLREEIRDCLTFLYFLNNPLDNINLAATLKGPFFGLDDRDIHRLFQVAKENNTSLYGAILLQGGKEELVVREKEGLGIKESLESKEADIAWRLASLRSQFGYKNLASLLRETIQESHFNVVLMGQPMGEERLSNVEKLLQIIENEDHLGKSNSEIVEYLRLREEFKESDAEVTVESDDKVLVMTVHAAKGLEFNRVILAGINHRSYGGYSSLIMFDKTEGLIIGLPNYLGNKKVKCSDPRFYQQKLQEKDEEFYEAQRLFYVAATRAKTELVLVLAGKFVPKKQKPANPILKLFNWNVDGKSVSYGDYEFNFVPYSYALEVDDIERIRLMPKGRIDKVEIYPKYRAISPTALVQYLECPRRFFLEQRLKVPKLESVNIELESEDMDMALAEEEAFDYDGQAIGTILHAVFEKAKDINEAKEILFQENIPEIYFKSVKNYFASEFFRKGKSEVPISLYLPEKNLRLIGIIDRILKEEDRFVIVDFKTNLRELSAYDDLAYKYEIQLAVYAKALKEKYNKPVEAVVFFTQPNIKHVVDLDVAIPRLEHLIDEVNMLLDQNQIPKPLKKDQCSKRCQYDSFCFVKAEGRF